MRVSLRRIEVAPRLQLGEDERARSPPAWCRSVWSVSSGWSGGS